MERYTGVERYLDNLDDRASSIRFFSVASRFACSVLCLASSSSRSACFSAVTSTITLTTPPACTRAALRIDAAGRSDVLEAPVRRIAQAVDAFGDERVDIALSVVAVCGQEPQ